MPYETIFLNGEREVLPERRALDYTKDGKILGITDFNEKYFMKRCETNTPLIITKSSVNSKIEKIIPIKNIKLFNKKD